MHTRQKNSHPQHSELHISVSFIKREKVCNFLCNPPPLFDVKFFVIFSCGGRPSNTAAICPSVRRQQRRVALKQQQKERQMHRRQQSLSPYVNVYFQEIGFTNKMSVKETTDLLVNRSLIIISSIARGSYRMIGESRRRDSRGAKQLIWNCSSQFSLCSDRI